MANLNLSTLGESIVQAWHSSTFGGDGSKRPCQVGTTNAYQAAYEPGQWGCTADGRTDVDSDKWYMGPARDWMSVHYEVPVIFSVVYLVVVYGLRQLMTQVHKPFGLQVPLVLWNFILAVFSIAGASYVVPEIVRFTLEEAGGDVVVDVCTVRTEAANPWVFYFILSKIPELVDTLFLALRKRPIIFLHTYHHVATMLYCWDAWVVLAPAGGPFAAMNLIVHSIMYTYYMIMALRIRLPAWISFVITSLQIIQMFGGMAVLIVAMQNCPTSSFASDSHLFWNYTLGLAMYVSYALLFINLFTGRYVFKSTPTATAGTPAVSPRKPKAE